jgi:hypothetical protein
MNLKSVALAVALMATTVSASAVTYSFVMPLSPAAPFSDFKMVSGLGAFTDFFNFTAPIGAIQASAATISIDLVPFANIDNLMVSLFNGTGPAVGSLVFAGGMGESSEMSNIPITAGNAYSFRVTGTVVGAPTGYYTFTAVAAPIPEPGTYALMLAGVSAIGFLAMRRRRQG